MGKYYDDSISSTPPEQAQQPIEFTPAQRQNYYEQTVVPQSPDVPQPLGMPNKVFGEMKPSDESWTQWARWKAMEGMNWAGVQPQYVQHLGNAAVDIANAATPMGSVLSAADASYNIPRGNTVAGALDVVGALPLIGTARRALPPSVLGQSIEALRLPRGGPEVVPAFTPPWRETRRGAPDVGGFVTPTNRELQTTARGQYRAIEQAPLTYHPNAMSDMNDWARTALPDPRFGPVFTQETAPNTFAMLDRYTAQFPPVQWRNGIVGGGNRPVTAYDFDGLRQQLRSQTGAEGAAGRQAADILDQYMLNPPRGMMLQGRDLLPELQAGYADARGNWRGFKTSEGVTDAIDAARVNAGSTYSGKNLDNATRQQFRKFVATPEGEAKLFGATPQQLNAIEDTAVGDWWTNKLRATGNRFGGGGGVAQGLMASTGAGIGFGAGHMMGLDPMTNMALGAAGGGIPASLGGAMRAAANARTTAAAENVAADIRRETPLSRARAALPENQPVRDAVTSGRDMMARALLRMQREPATNYFNSFYTPYENRGDANAP